MLVKRDDLTGLALGGNKARKLEYLCAEALAQGCDTLVTGGGAPEQPRAHDRGGRQPARPRLPPRGRRPRAQATVSGNLLLDVVLGATLHYTGAQAYYEIESAIEELAAQLAKRRPAAVRDADRRRVGHGRGRRTHGQPTSCASSSTPTGDGRVDWVVVADGSGGTHAGLLAGLD